MVDLGEDVDRLRGGFLVQFGDVSWSGERWVKCCFSLKCLGILTVGWWNNLIMGRKAEELH